MLFRSSDPIGGLIDELTGRTVKRSRTKGTSRQGGLGDLLPFEHGGAVRHGYEDGGTPSEDRIPVLSDIGDALSSLFSGGEGAPDVVAQDTAAPRRAAAADEVDDLRPLSQFLLSAGLGMMASPSRYPLESIGRGGLIGLEYMQAARAENEQRRKELREVALRQKEMELANAVDEPMAPTTRVPVAAPIEPVEPVAKPEKVAEVAPIKGAPTEAAPTEAAPTEAAAPATEATPKTPKIGRAHV